jgi:predicted porin
MHTYRPALCLLLATVACSASAQTSATVFGVADVSMRRISNGPNTVYGVGSGGAGASRTGVRMNEDLGGGMSAGAWLEGTVNFDDGTTNASRFWNRRATVSLAGPFGEIRLGHDLTPGYTSFGEFDTFGVSGLSDQGKFYSSSAAVFGSGIDATGVWARADNMVAYYTPNTLGGFYAQLAVAAGEGLPSKKYRGGRIGYAAGPLHITAAHSLFDGIGGQTLKRSAVSGSYDIDVAKFYLSMVRNAYGGASRLVTQVGAIVPVSGPHKVKLNYTRANASGSLGSTSVAANDATQVALGYTYDFSKRTMVYATYVDIANKGAAAFAVGTPPAAAAGRNSSGAEFGISHRF